MCICVPLRCFFDVEELPADSLINLYLYYMVNVVAVYWPRILEFKYFIVTPAYIYFVFRMMNWMEGQMIIYPKAPLLDSIIKTQKVEIYKKVKSRKIQEKLVFLKEFDHPNYDSYEQIDEVIRSSNPLCRL